MNERRRILLRTVPFLAIGVLVFILYLARFVNIPEMVGWIQRANMLVYSLAALALIFDSLFFALAWQYFLRPLSVKIPLKKTFAYVWIGIFTDLLIPAESVSGEIVKAYLMSKEPNVDPGKVIASLVSQRILGTIATATALCVSLLGLLIFNYPVSALMLQTLTAVTIVSVIAFAFLVAVCVKEDWSERLVNAVLRLVERISRGRFRLAHFRTRIVEALRTFHKSFEIFGSKPTTLIPSVFFYVMAWLSSILIVFLVFISIGYLEPNVPILLLKVVVVYTLLVAVKSVPIGVPAEVGLPDILLTTLFILFGIPPDISAAATILTRILTLWLRFIIGFVAVQWFGVKILVESGVIGKAKDTV